MNILNGIAEYLHEKGYHPIINDNILTIGYARKTVSCTLIDDTIHMTNSIRTYHHKTIKLTEQDALSRILSYTRKHLPLPQHYELKGGIG